MAEAVTCVAVKRWASPDRSDREAVPYTVVIGPKQTSNRGTQNYYYKTDGKDTQTRKLESYTRNDLNTPPQGQRDTDDMRPAESRAELPSRRPRQTGGDSTV